MSDKTIEGYGKGYLVLLLPISFLIVFLVATWRIWVGIITLILGVKVWRHYEWQSWCQRVNPVFNQMIYENQGKITPMDLATRCNFSGTVAKRYLDTKAEEFGVIPFKSDGVSQVYYFLTAVTLGNILDSSEPTPELKPAISRTPNALLTAPVIEEKKELEEVVAEATPPPQQQEQQETKLTLEKQLLFGSLIQSELAKRLNVYSSTVYKRRKDPDFPEWSRKRDPDGIAWVYSSDTKEFFPEDKEEV
ncbi:MAG: hypothetical protein HRU34_17225 [Richelia sp.]|nr:hypothetical protein [Richelia sp.]